MRKPTQKKTDQSMDVAAYQRGDTPKSYVAHLSELRNYLIIGFVVILFGFAIASFFSEELLSLFQLPLKKYAPAITLKYDYMGESILIKLKLAFALSLFATLPVIITLIWGYIKPAVDKGDRLFIRVLLFTGILLFYTGLFFSYYFVTPFTIKMIESFAHKNVPNNINITNYFNFMMLMVTIQGGLFELPIIIAILTRMGLITPSFLSSKRKYAYVVMWIFAALITPQDIWTQALVAVPLMLLYEISILISVILSKLKKRKQEKLS